MTGFTHLHCHSEYSLLDGAIRIKDLCARAVDLGFSAAAITDHGNLFGALPFYLEAKKTGIKPIIGSEVYVADDMLDRENKQRFHLVLLAQNLTGYQNLLKIVSAGFLNGFYYRPRVDKKYLQQHNEGLICLSACLQGEVPNTLLHSTFDAAMHKAREYKAIFPDRFYLELQSNGLKEQAVVNTRLMELGRELSLPLVATNDCHYLDKDDYEAHDILLCVGTGKIVSESKRLKFDTNEFYYKAPEEMESAFAHCPEALENVGRIVDQCEVELPLNQHFFPVYDVPEGATLDSEFRRLAEQGLTERLAALPYAVDEQEYRSRLEFELDVIISKGFPAYFLIVQDFINWAKTQGIPVGPGRGSAAGSLVSYALRITDLDPIRYHLFFERFLNVERASMPDIDVDFCYNRRSDVIKYVTEKYGHDHVAQIVAFGTMKAKGVIRDVARALNISLKDADRIAKLIPDDLKMTLDKALDQEPELRSFIETEPQFRKLFDISRRLEGLTRHSSIHAAGIVISQKPMVEYLPLHRGKNGEVVTQFDMKKVEKVGLIKFDFLGLKTLTVLDDALKLIRKNGKNTPNLEALPLDDSATFELLCRAETDGVFQLESDGMRRVLKGLKPSCFEDIIALLALYRPGPLESGMVDDFVGRKHGLRKVEYEFPELAPIVHPILEDTYGVILYQEQVMKIASDLAKYSLGEGDNLRRAMGKKDPAEMAKQRVRFLAGTRENGISQDAAGYIFDLMEKFAGYGFNKSHSAAYALISYQTAYVKAHFPSEFMAAMITSEVSNSDKILAHVSACRDIGIEILPPDINKSFYEFTVESEAIRYGLSGIKGVGEGAVKSLEEERAQNGEFSSLLDLCTRVNLRQVNKKVLEALIKSGSMDIFGCNRRTLMEGLERVLSMAQKRAKRKISGQRMFTMNLHEENTCSLTGLGLYSGVEDAPEYKDDEKFRMEKEAFGFFLIGHPLQPFRQEIRRMGYFSLSQCAELPEKTPVHVAVLVTGVKTILTKKGDRMAFCAIEDLSGSGEAIVFSEPYAAHRDALASEEPLLLIGTVGRPDLRNGDEAEGVSKKAKIVVESCKPLAEAVGLGSEPVVLCVQVRNQKPAWSGLQDILRKYPGKAPVQLDVARAEYVCRLQCGPDFWVAPCPDFWQDIELWKQGAAQGQI
ncbi:MAG: DNA polymerase III subunit alpha [Desulfovibrionales bacterium]|nr:DNA polymerase III subunit alpha [Desulfovibrionales bacterium]